MKQPANLKDALRSLFAREKSSQNDLDSAVDHRDAKQVLFFEGLEPRILYSAAPVEIEGAEEPTNEGEAADVGPVTNAVQAPEINAPTVEAEFISSEDPMTSEEAEQAVVSLAEAAIFRWQEAGINEEQLQALYQIEYVVKDLGGTIAGQTNGIQVTIDDNAGGLGWFIDGTPDEDEEYRLEASGILFSESEEADRGIDLLTVLMHEQGHVLGLGEADRLEASSVMYQTQFEGIRKLPVAGQADGAVSGTQNAANASTAGSGDFVVLTEAGGADAITTADFVHTFDTTDAGSGSSHNSGTVGLDGNLTLSAGHHLVLYNSRFDSTSGSNRSEVQTHLTLNGTDLSTGWSQGYIRRGSGADETITAGGGIIEATAGDTLNLVSFRTDNNNTATVQREPNGTGLQVIKLDDNASYARLSAASVAGGTVDQNSAATAEAVSYGTQDELDSAGFSYNAASGELTLTNGGNYMVFTNNYLDHTNGNARSSYQQFLALDGTEVDGTRSTIYLRGSNSAQEGAIGYGGVIQATAGQVLTVNLFKDGASQNVGIDRLGNRSSLTIVELPSTSEVIRISDDGVNGTNTATNPASGTAFTFQDQDQTNATFTHTASQSQVTVNQDDQYLFFHQHLNEDPTTAEDDIRTLQSIQLSVNGTNQVEGGSGRFNRDGNPSYSAGNWGGAILDLSTSDNVELTSTDLGANVDVFWESVSLQGVRVNSLFQFGSGPVISHSRIEVDTSGANNALVLTTAELNGNDPDSAAVDVIFTLNTAITGGTLTHSTNGVLG
ncbi:MAG: LEPR-XLL domain-containing protein, partial [Verrucomicrobiota bacterium]